MTSRVIILRLMLGMLFVACATAILAIFVSFKNDFGGRLVGSSVLLAVGCAVLLPITPKENTQRLSLSGRAWIGVVAFQVLAGLFLIWEDLIGGASWIRNGTVSCAMFVVFAGMCAAIAPMQQLQHRDGKLLNISKMATWLIGLLTIGIALALLTTGYKSSSIILLEKLMGSWFTLICSTIVLSCCACGLIRGTPRWRKALAIIGLTATSCGVSCWMFYVLSNFDSSISNLLWTALVSSGIAAGIGILSIGLALPVGRVESRLLPWIALLTAVAGWLAGNMAQRESSLSLGLTERLLAATLVLDGCLGLTVIIFYVIGRRGATKDWMITGAILTCPRCGKKAVFSTGENPCIRCGFHVLIAFRDEKCSRCKHDVRHLPNGNPCPECGLAVESSAANYLLAGATGTETPSV